MGYKFQLIFMLGVQINIWFFVFKKIQSRKITVIDEVELSECIQNEGKWRILVSCPEDDESRGMQIL